MINPSLSTSSSGVQAGMQQQNPINDPSVSNGQGYNTFTPSRVNSVTARFGEVTPFFSMQGVPKDRIMLRSPHALKTYTLNAPIMFPVKMSKSFYSVPYSCLYSFNWERVFRNPVKGDDIPDDAYLGVDIQSLIEFVFKYLKNIDAIPAETPNYNVVVSRIGFEGIVLMSDILSRGSLLDYLEIRVQHEYFDGDDFIEKFFGVLVAAFGEDAQSFTLAKINTNNLVVDPKSLVSWRDFFYTFYHSFDDVVFQDSSQLAEVVKALKQVIRLLPESILFFSKDVSLDRPLAYQLIGAQFFSNDSVDDIFSSDTWFDNEYSLASLVLGPWPTFDYNGIKCQYDIFSKHVVQKLLSSIYDEIPTDNSYVFSYFHNLLGYYRNLKFGDYFTTARTSPLAVGDVNIPVVGENVSAIDVTKNISLQRFLNAANRAGNLLQDYSKSIFGVAPANLPPQPRFISTTVSVLGNNETVNTSDNQGKMTTNMSSYENQYAFDCFIDEQSVVIGVCYFDIPITYANSTDKTNFAMNRFDWFQPWLQNIGDQTIDGLELGRKYYDSYKDVFGYTIRDAEFKLSYNTAHGGFYKWLPNWLFISDTSRSSAISHSKHIDSNFLRFLPSDFDTFYSSLTGLSQDSYFHFIIQFSNQVTSNRAMQYKPGIL